MHYASIVHDSSLDGVVKVNAVLVLFSVPAYTPVVLICIDTTMHAAIYESMTQAHIKMLQYTKPS